MADHPVGSSLSGLLTGAKSGRDPVRIFVQAALAIYLSPILLILCLIGGASLLAGGLARIAHRPSQGLARPNLPMAGPGMRKPGYRLASHRAGSHAAR